MQETTGKQLQTKDSDSKDTKHVHSWMVYKAYNNDLNKDPGKSHRIVLECTGCSDSYNSDVTLGSLVPKKGSNSHTSGAYMSAPSALSCPHEWRFEGQEELGSGTNISVTSTCALCQERRSSTVTLVNQRFWMFECVHGVPNFGPRCVICDKDD